MTDQTQPPAAPETDVSAWAERFLVQCGPCDGGLPMACACPTEDPRPVIAALLERVRVVEGERDRWQDKAQEAGEAYANANSRHHEELDRANRLEGMCDRLAERAVELEDAARAATARAESAEAAHRALQAAVEALADEWEADFMAYRHDNPGHLRLRALLAGGEER